MVWGLWFAFVCLDFELVLWVMVIANLIVSVGLAFGFVDLILWCLFLRLRFLCFDGFSC